MKKLLPLPIVICFWTAFLSCIHAHAQQVEFLDLNNIKAGFGIGGNLFTKADTTGTNQLGLLEAPKGSGIAPAYTAALWMSAIDAGGNLRCSAQRFRQGGNDFFDGPISVVYDAFYDTYYKRVFKITRTQIDHHKAMSFPVPVAQIDSDVLKWPSRGNPYVLSAYLVNISSKLAPFVDVDGDQKYDPAKGDFPAICGDEAIFFAFNDNRGLHGETLGLPMGVEVRGLAEVYLETIPGGLTTFQKSAVNNTVFVSYEIENKSMYPYFNFRLSLYEDCDLGCFNNDRVGCDTLRSLMLVYNGSAVDLTCVGIHGYGTKKVAHGIKFLNHHLGSFAYFRDDACPAHSDPLSSGQYRNYMTGFWNDGSRFTEGWGGYTGIYPTSFLFPGNPNDTTEWSDRTSLLAAGERRMLGTLDLADTFHTAFFVGEIINVDAAFITTFDSTGTNFSIVDTLKRDADEVQKLYDTKIKHCRLSGTPVILSWNEIPDSPVFTVYPNPASTHIIVCTENKIESLQIIDLQGKVILTNSSETNRLMLNTSSLAAGMYLISLKRLGKTAIKKIVIY